MKSTLKWKQATTIYPTDHIISSKAREVGAWGFKPQYENDKHVNIRFILSHEYNRLWLKERDLYQKENYSKQEKARNEANLKRGFVQRMMTNPKLLTRELPIIHLKRFQNVASRIDNRKPVDETTKVPERPPKTLERYKPSCTAPKQKTTATDSQKKTVNPKQKQSGKEKAASPESEAGGSDAGDCHLVCKLI